jgi:hypothetical protein
VRLGRPVSGLLGLAVCPFERCLGAVAWRARRLLVGVVVASRTGDREGDAVIDLGGGDGAVGSSELAAVAVALEDATVVGLALPAALAEAVAMPFAPGH